MRELLEEHVAIDPGSKGPLLVMLIPALVIAAYFLVRYVEGLRERTGTDHGVAVNDVVKRNSARTLIKLAGKPCIDVCGLTSVGTSEIPALRITCNVDWSAPPCTVTRAYLLTVK